MTETVEFKANLKVFVSCCESDVWKDKKYKALVLKYVPCILKYMACIFCDKPCVFFDVCIARPQKRKFFSKFRLRRQVFGLWQPGLGGSFAHHAARDAPKGLFPIP